MPEQRVLGARSGLLAPEPDMLARVARLVRPAFATEENAEKARAFARPPPACGAALGARPGARPESSNSRLTWEHQRPEQRAIDLWTRREPTRSLRELSAV